MSGAAAIWHDVECGAYAADLSLWSSLAAEAGGPVLDLGCGTGRVALHLARRGFDVVGLDFDADLVRALRERGEGLPCAAVLADAREFQLEREFGLGLAPMQLLQLFSDAAERTACMRSVAACLRPGGAAAVAIVESVVAGMTSEAEAVPDAREVDGWLYASLPLETAVDAERIRVRRLRKRVSPAGTLHRSDDEIVLRRLTAATVEAEAGAAGLRPAGRLEISPTLDHVGSTVVVLRKGA